MAIFRRGPIHRNGDGRYTVDLSDDNREVMVAVAEQIRELMDQPDSPGLHRSFPPAYQGVENLAHADEYRRLMHDELAAKHREAIDTLTESARATELTEEQLYGWMLALNQLRLVVGTRIGLEGNDDEVPDDIDGQVYHFLTAVQSLVIDALSS